MFRGDQTCLEEIGGPVRRQMWPRVCGMLKMLNRSQRGFQIMSSLVSRDSRNSRWDQEEKVGG